ncbi:nucleotidyltransferase family protein [Jiella sonneratiae]|uniref:Nucleotidyltransferase domain-containing protein n=1 Tax=Jiella sonneratiae TaxID=2816856 RepID=A0ABS3J5J0_9HYPH|nr:nucleotidyltransferase domain-containing protein [Jiella sonneratiae]MBO0904405.1 nucleotidyltransferase domain-containing protein [Jiella sonneratiae]
MEVETMEVTTIGERRANEAERRRKAADAVVAALARYASRHGGRFVVFGSYVSGTMRFDSDFDVLLDFPKEASAEAWRFVEEACAERDLPVDIHDASTTTVAFVSRVCAAGMIVP